MEKILIRTENLSKRFGGVRCQAAQLEVKAEKFWVPWPAAQKTTTIKMLTGLLEPSAGRNFICSYDIVREPAKPRLFSPVPTSKLIAS